MYATPLYRVTHRLRAGALLAATALLAGATVAEAQDTARGGKPAAAAPAGQAAAPAGQATAPAPAAPDSVKLPPEQLQSLVAPIALYPDDLLAQTLVASTYPLEIVQLQQWMAKNPNLKDKALADSVAKMPWDPSIQSMAAVPEVCTVSGEV